MYRLLLVPLFLIPFADALCPSEFETVNFGCYLFGQTAVGSYNDAFLRCFNRGGYLLNIDTESENNITTDTLKEQTNVFDGFWTGGIFDGQQWVWQKTSDWNGVVVKKLMDPNGYSNWGLGQPGGWFGQNNKMAIMRNLVSAPYKWYNLNDWFLQARMSYICEADYKLP